MFPWKLYKEFCRVMAKELRTETSVISSAINEDIDKDCFKSYEYSQPILLEGNDWKYSEAVPSNINATISPENKYREFELRWRWTDAEEVLFVIIRLGWQGQHFFGQMFLTEPGGDTSDVIEMRNGKIYRYEEDA